MTADELFKTELANRGLRYEITEEGLYRVEIGDTTATVDLENVAITNETATTMPSHGLPNCSMSTCSTNLTGQTPNH